MKFAHLLSRFQNSAWFIREESLVAITELLAARVNNAALPIVDPGDSDTEEPDQETLSLLSSGVAVVDVQGVLGKRLSLMETMCGGCDYDQIIAEAQAAVQLPNVQAVILRFDSPGGTVVGCQEAYGRLSALVASTPKPIVAFTETECCSAAYWLASACDAIYATGSSMVGSTGAKVVVRDQTEKNAKEGVKFTVFKSGTMKDIGAPYRAMTDEEAKIIQASIDADGARFRAAVLAERPQVAEECFTTALFYNGTQGQQLGLVDKVVTSLSDVVADLTAP